MSVANEITKMVVENERLTTEEKIDGVIYLAQYKCWSAPIRAKSFLETMEKGTEYSAREIAERTTVNLKNRGWRYSSRSVGALFKALTKIGALEKKVVPTGRILKIPSSTRAQYEAALMRARIDYEYEPNLRSLELIHLCEDKLATLPEFHEIEEKVTLYTRTF